MDTKRPPALTSPWKIGFLVSLFMIFLSVGVNYMIFRTFNLTWTCIGIDQGSFFFHRDQFLSQLAPMIGLVLLASLIAYFSITAAVSKYKIYLDSGQDYRNLIRVIREATDLDDENMAADLKKYPELREMLNSFRKRTRGMEKRLAEREKQMEKREKNSVSTSQLKKECQVLAKAIESRPADGRPKKLDLSISELRSLEKAIRKMPAPRAGESSADDGANQQLEDLRREFQNTNDFIRSRLEESASELRSNCASAQEIEKKLSELCGESMDGLGGASGDLGKDDLKILHQMLDTIEKVSGSLIDLGEEAKGVAINTALQAGSGEGAMADLIQLAEDVRRVAIKFTDVASSYQGTVNEMRKSVTEVENQFISRTVDSASGEKVSGALAAVRSKISLLVERMVILSDQFKNMEETIGLSMPAGDDQPMVQTAVEETAVDDFEVVSSGQNMFEVNKGADQVFSEDEEIDKCIPGLEKDTGQIFKSEQDEDSEMFADLSKAAESSVDERAAGSEVNEPVVEFEELPPAEAEPAGGAVDPPSQEAEEPVADFAEESLVRSFGPLDETAGPSPEAEEVPLQQDQPLPEIGESLPELVEEVTEIPDQPQRVYDLDEPAAAPDPEPSPRIDPMEHNTISLSQAVQPESPVEASPPADLETGESDEEEAIDLYALGAVDYVA